MLVEAFDTSSSVPNSSSSSAACGSAAAMASVGDAAGGDLSGETFPDMVCLRVPLEDPDTKRC